MTWCARHDPSTTRHHAIALPFKYAVGGDGGSGNSKPGNAGALPNGFTPSGGGTGVGGAAGGANGGGGGSGGYGNLATAPGAGGGGLGDCVWGIGCGHGSMV